MKIMFNFDELDASLTLRNLSRDEKKAVVRLMELQIEETAKVYTAKYAAQQSAQRTVDNVGESMLAHCVPEPGKICSKPATFNVWFEQCDGLYGFMCDEHTAKAIVEGVNGYRVYQITALKEDSQYPIPVLT